MISEQELNKIVIRKRKLCKKIIDETIEKNEDMRYRAFIYKYKKLRQQLGE